MIKSKEEIIKRLKQLKHIRDNDPYSDAEDIHMQCDDLLLYYINDEEIKEAYNSIRKYYS